MGKTNHNYLFYKLMCVMTASLGHWLPEYPLRNPGTCMATPDLMSWRQAHEPPYLALLVKSTPGCKKLAWFKWRAFCHLLEPYCKHCDVAETPYQPPVFQIGINKKSYQDQVVYGCRECSEDLKLWEDILYLCDSCGGSFDLLEVQDEYLGFIINRISDT